MIDAIISRVEVLLNQRRFKEAEELIQEGISIDPNHPHLIILSADLSYLQEDYARSLELIHMAMAFAADEPYLHYLKSRSLVALDRYSDAEKSIEQAIHLDADQADYFAFWAYIKLDRKQFEEALNLANKALEIDSENLLGRNSRSTALLKLNRNEESSETIEEALNEDPDNVFTHSNYGWNLLEQGKHQEALRHFNEALQLDPNFELAQEGMKEAIKAKYVVYRWFLKYKFWMSNMTAKYQWGFVIGFYLLYRGLALFAENNPAYSVFVTPILILYLIFALSSWVMTPISNLFLRFNPYGKHLLKPYQKMSSNFVAGSVLLCLIGLLLYATGQGFFWILVALYGFSMMIPLSVMFNPSKRKVLLMSYSIGLGVVGILALIQILLTQELFTSMANLYVWGFFIYQFTVNYLLVREDNK